MSDTPTGGGKLLCYQIPAIARQRAGHGATLVISPLIALMQDQVDALHEAGVAASFLNSTQDWREAQAVERQLLAGHITFVISKALSSRYFCMLAFCVNSP